MGVSSRHTWSVKTWAEKIKGIKLLFLPLTVMPWADLLLVHVIIFYFPSKKEPLVSCYKDMISYEIALSGGWGFEINGKPRKSMIETLNSLPLSSQDYPPPFLWHLTSRWPWICMGCTVGSNTRRWELEFSLVCRTLTCLIRLLGALANRKGGKECFERQRETSRDQSGRVLWISSSTSQGIKLQGTPLWPHWFAFAVQDPVLSGSLGPHGL